MQYHKIYLLSILLLVSFIGCEKEITKGLPSHEATLLVQNMKQFSLDLMRINANKKVESELLDLIANPDLVRDKITVRGLLFSDTFRKGTRKLRKAFFALNGTTEGAFNNKSGESAAYIQNLLDNNVGVEIPYVPSEYDNPNQEIAYTYDPMDGSESNEAFVFEKAYKSLIADDDYLELSPLAIVGRYDDDYLDPPYDTGYPSGGNTGGGTQNNLEEFRNPNMIYTVRLGYVYLRTKYDSGLFGGGDTQELRFARASASSFGANPVAGFGDEIHANVTRRQRRYAAKGWAKGWVAVGDEVMSDWLISQTDILVGAWEKDNSGTITISGPVSFKLPNDQTQTINVSKTYSSENDRIGVHTYSRDYFFAVCDEGNPAVRVNGADDGLYGGFRAFNFGQNLYFTLEVESRPR